MSDMLEAARARRDKGSVSNYSRPSQRRAMSDARSSAWVASTAQRTRMAMRAQSNGSGDYTFEGHASITETPYVMYDMFGAYNEVVSHDAFEWTLSQTPDVPFLLNHGGMTLARTKSGTLDLDVDSEGLLTNARLSRANSIVADMYDAMTRGDLDEMSFAFLIRNGEWTPDYQTYVVKSVDINKGDVSVVNYGANPATAGATMRSAAVLEGIGTLNLESLQDAADRIEARRRALAGGTGEDRRDLDTAVSTEASLTSFDLAAGLARRGKRRRGVS